MTTIPIVDFSKISYKNGRIPSYQDWLEVANQVGSALSNIGFVYIKNHEVPEDKKDRNHGQYSPFEFTMKDIHDFLTIFLKIERAFEVSKTFFELPPEIKGIYTKNGKESNYGYAKPGQELLHPNSTFELRETFDISPFPTNDLKVPSKEIPNFYPGLSSIANESKVVVKKLLKILAISLKLEDEDFFVNSAKSLDDINVKSFNTFRTLYYPAISDNLNIPKGAVRCAEHSDYGILTLLYQDDLGGLEVKNVKGNWIPAVPIKGTILVNTGDLLEFWSGGHFPATHHRVLMPLLENQRKARQSITYFIHPDDSVLVCPLKPGQNFEPVSAYEHAKKRLELSYQY